MDHLYPTQREIDTASGYNKQKFKVTMLAFAVATTFLSYHAKATNQLDMSFIHGGSEISKDVWDALHNNYAPGQYLVDVYLNGKFTGKRILDVSPQDSDRLCLTEDWLTRTEIYVDHEYFSKGYNKERRCYILDDSPSVSTDFDVSTQTLSLSIPQIGLVRIPKNLDWNYGTSAFRVNYNANANAGRYSTAAFGSADLKANVGHWVLSSTATASNSNRGNDDASIDMFTATRAIRKLSADLSIGKTQTGNNLLGSTGTYGVSLTHNNSMRPGNLGYSPEFTGIANSPSRVSLTQAGRLIHSEVVPTGPFTIKDVPLYTSGDVIMTITGEDGREQTQVFPLSVVAGQISPGQYEFNIAAGMPDDNSDIEGGVISASYGYGFNNLTLRAGGVFNSDYLGLAAGTVTGIGSLGAISVDFAYSKANYEHQSDKAGNKIGLTWSKLLEGTSTGLRLDWSAQDSEFEDMSSFDPKRLWQGFNRVKNEWSAGISQPVGGLFSLSLSGWQRTYHDNPYARNRHSYYKKGDKDTGITGTLSSNINGVNINLAGSGSRNTYGVNDWAVSASVSVPFSLFERRYNSSTSISSSKNGGTGFSSGISGSLNDRFNYGLGIGNDSNGTKTSYLNTSYSSDVAYLNSSLNYSSSVGASGSVSVTGSVLAVPAANDIIMSRTTGDTVAVVNVKDTPGVRLISGNGETNSSGNLVVPLNSYDWNTVTVDASSLPLNTELIGTSQKIVPAKEAVVWMPFDSLKVKRYLLQIKMPNGEFVPGGTWARDSRNTPLGFVANNGVLMINTVDDPGKITLGKCIIPAGKIKDTEKLQEITCE